MENNFFMGIDLDEKNAVVSYYQLNRREPETVSMVAGSEQYQIPVFLAKQKESGRWLVGEEARQLYMEGDENAVCHLQEDALAGRDVEIDGERMSARELLALFLKKMIILVGSLQKPVMPDLLVITVDGLSKEKTELYLGMAPAIGMEPGKLTLLDRSECFYYFAYSQREEFYLHDVVLFDYDGRTLICRRLERDIRTKPQLLTMTEEKAVPETGLSDALFLQYAKVFMGGRTITTVYLVGDGFDGDKMRASLAFLCRGRRVFLGKNLYSKGACYAAVVRKGMVYWPFVYMGDTEMKVNVSLKVKNNRRTDFFTLISAGDNRYEAIGECEVILSGTPEIDFWLQLPNSREAKIEKLQLSDFPKRPDRVSRLRITARPLSDREVLVTIRDMGFGEIFKSSERSWEYRMSLVTE